MKPINGVYVGWIPPNSHLWEPLYRTIRDGKQYKNEKTRAYDPTIARYPGLDTALNFKPNPVALPYALERRRPLNRADYEYNAQVWDLRYPIPDVLEYVGRTSGQCSGDPFTICPIVEPNDDGTYSYVCGVWGLDPAIHDTITQNTPLGIVTEAENATCVMADGLFLGRLSPHFTMLSDSIFDLTIVKIARREGHTGCRIIVSFNTPVDLYATPEFAVVSNEVASV